MDKKLTSLFIALALAFTAPAQVGTPIITGGGGSIIYADSLVYHVDSCACSDYSSFTYITEHDTERYLIICYTDAVCDTVPIFIPGGAGLWARTGSVIYPVDSTWNVGIGTTMPEKTLDVRGTFQNFTIDITQNGIGNSDNLFGTLYNGSGMIRVDSAGTIHFMGTIQHSNGQEMVYAVSLDTSGNRGWMVIQPGYQEWLVGNDDDGDSIGLVISRDEGTEVYGSKFVVESDSIWLEHFAGGGTQVLGVDNSGLVTAVTANTWLTADDSTIYWINGIGDTVVILNDPDNGIVFFRNPYTSAGARFAIKDSSVFSFGGGWVTPKIYGSGGKIEIGSRLILSDVPSDTTGLIPGEVYKDNGFLKIKE